MDTNLAVGDPQQLHRMVRAARDMGDVEAEIEATGWGLVGSLLPAGSELFEWRHYPSGDVWDTNTNSQYFYHVHPKLETWEEHGHFHLFRRQVGPTTPLDHDENGAPSHLIAISMDLQSRPVRLFTTNRWVTGEAWLDAPSVIELLAGFKVAADGVADLTSRWLTNLAVLFAPQIEQLILARDRTIQRRLDMGDALEIVLEDRKLENASHMEIDLAHQIGQILRAAGDSSNENGDPGD